MNDRHAATPITLDVHRAACARINNVLRKSIAPRLLSEVSWGGDPLKELSESLVVFDAAVAVMKSRGIDRNDPSVFVAVVGDGHSPRTGALVALSTRWNVTSIDPLLDRHGEHPRIARLQCIRGRIEAHELHADLVLAVHSHAPVNETRRIARVFNGSVVSMPCCYAWPSIETTVSHVAVCMAPDRTIYVERTTKATPS